MIKTNKGELISPGRVEDLSIFLAFFAIAILVVFPLRSFDIFWHMANGRAMVEAGRIISEDVLSYTASGVEYPNSYWLAQIIFYLVFQNFGVPGLLVLKVVLTLFVSAGLYSSLRFTGVSKIVAGLLCLLAIFLGLSRFSVRPEIFTLLYLVLTLLVLEGFRRNRFQRGALFWLPVIMITWNFFHTGIFGLVLIGAFTLGEGLKFFLHSRFPGWIGLEPMATDRLKIFTCFVFATLILTFAGPPFGFYYEIVATFLTKAQTLNGVQEFKSTPFAGYLPFWTYLVVSAMSLLLGGRRLNLTHLLVFLPFAYLAIRYRRAVGPFVLVTMPFFASALVIMFNRWSESRAFLKFRSGVAWITFVCILGVVFHYKFLYDQARDPFGWHLKEGNHPVGSARFIETVNLEGNMFNSDRFGGYLAYFLGPERKIFTYNMPGVYKDNRWDFAHSKEKREEFNINYAVIAEASMMGLVFPVNEWAPVYSEPGAMVLVRRSPGNREIIDKYEVKHFFRYFKETIPEEYFWVTANDPSSFVSLAREMGNYLSFRKDELAARLFGELLGKSHPALSKQERIHLLKAAMIFNDHSESLRSRLMLLTEGRT